MRAPRTTSMQDIRNRPRGARSMGGPRPLERAALLPRLSARMLVALGLMLSGLLLAVCLQRTMAWVAARPMFQIHRVTIVGDLEQVDRDLLSKRALALHGSFFGLDLAAANAELRGVPWVREVDVRRIWPDGLEIDVEEHRPLARWGDSELLNTRGERFAAEYSGVLPYFQGPKGSESQMAETYRTLLARLQALPLSITDLELSERGAWRLTADNGLELELGREQIEDRLDRFIAIYPQLLRVASPAGAVADLRYAHGFALRSGNAAKDSSS